MVLIIYLSSDRAYKISLSLSSPGGLLVVAQIGGPGFLQNRGIPGILALNLSMRESM